MISGQEEGQVLIGVAEFIRKPRKLMIFTRLHAYEIDTEIITVTITFVGTK